jgi:hypothetical protein
LNIFIKFIRTNENIKKIPNNLNGLGAPGEQLGERDGQVDGCVRVPKVDNVGADVVWGLQKTFFHIFRTYFV